MNKEQRKQAAFTALREHPLVNKDDELYYGEMVVLGDVWSTCSNNPQAVKDDLKATGIIKRELEGLK